MANKKDPSQNKEEKDVLRYSEHMSLRRNLIRIVIRRDRVKEGQRSTYD